MNKFFSVFVFVAGFLLGFCAMGMDNNRRILPTLQGMKERNQQKGSNDWLVQVLKCWASGQCRSAALPDYQNFNHDRDRSVK